MKRLIKLLTALLASVLLITALPSCSGRPPKLEGALYDRLVEVIEASVDVNVVLFGAGLPTYAREGVEEDRIRRYYGVTVPLFVDNAEAVTKLERCHAQVIRLVVSEDDKELRIV